MTDDKHISKQLAKRSLACNAIKVNPSKPFRWASGYYMPIYNDNRALLSDFENRALVSDGFQEIVNTHHLAADVIAGIATGGISPATTFADNEKSRFIYVRAQVKSHGLAKQIEGVLNPGDSVLLIEDVVSTGGSSVAALEAVRAAGGDVKACLSIFSYGFEMSAAKFKQANCPLYPVFTFKTLIDVLVEESKLSSEERVKLDEWVADPFAWGEKQGYTRE